MAPLDSDYSGDWRASTCRSLQSSEGGFALLPRQPGMELAQPHLFSMFLFSASYLYVRPSLSGILAISRIFLATNLTLATVPCAEQSILLSGDNSKITQLTQNMGRHADTPPVRACSVSQISQSAGLLWAGCSKGNRRPKKRTTSCEVTMVTARPGALAAC